MIGACGTVEIKDQEVCIDLVEDGGTCNHTLQDLPAVYAPGSEWDLKRYGRISLSPEGFGELKIEIEQLCEVSKKCTWEFKKKMANLWKWYEQNKPKKQPEAEEEPDNGVIPDSVWEEHTQGPWKRGEMGPIQMISVGGVSRDCWPDQFNSYVLVCD